jgi:hypothetical protein
VGNRFARISKRLTNWLERRGETAAWLWVHENPGGSFNTHLVIHLHTVSLEALAKKLSALCGAIDRAAIDVRPRRERGGPDRLIQYISKGTDAVTVAKAHGRARGQGTVFGKRCGWSQNLGVAARKRLGLHAKNCAQTCTQCLTKVNVGERSQTDTAD